MLDQDYNIALLNQPVDIREEFARTENIFFLADQVSGFNSKKRTGTLLCRRHERKARVSFNDGRMPFEESISWEFPPHYDNTFPMDLMVDFITDRCVRIRLKANRLKKFEESSLMLSGPVSPANNWELKEHKDGITYQSASAALTLSFCPFHIIFRDAKGKALTQTNHFSDSKGLLNCDPIPFCALSRLRDSKTHIASSFSLFPDEKLFGCGESFTALNKRGQKLVLYSKDPHGVQTPNMYKPIPFFMSSRGYGMFYHTSAPLTFDMGYTHDAANISFLGDDMLDLFLFAGTPKEILSEYTALTGRASLPPLWSFGLWMSRITYKSEEEVRTVAKRLRAEKIPCDVIHVDTGWFEEEWKCDYKFSGARFKDPAAMAAELKKDGFSLSLWQYPYFTPANPLFQEAVDRKYCVLHPDSVLPTKDAVLDFSSPDACAFYESLLAPLLLQGVSCIKADFGEAAPFLGYYASGKTGFYEHNLYPLRYNKAVSSITEKITGSSIIWARSAWAGSQRYPVHWGGDSEASLSGMKATLRAGLSLGLCGFSFWSHDIGGFAKQSPEELYRRWLPFGMLTSHARCHGQPPKEPWEYGKSFTDYFRRAANMRYQLLPYIYEEAKKAAREGFPMMRPLFFEYPEDPASWLVDDAYFFGEKLLAAPIFEDQEMSRSLYVPEGRWINYFTGALLEGSRWHTIKAEEFPIIVLVKEGESIPQVSSPIQSTAELSIKDIRVYTACEGKAGYSYP